MDNRLANFGWLGLLGISGIFWKPLYYLFFLFALFLLGLVPVKREYDYTGPDMKHPHT